MHVCAGVLYYASAFVSYPNGFRLCVCDSSGKQMGEHDVREHCLVQTGSCFACVQFRKCAISVMHERAGALWIVITLLIGCSRLSCDAFQPRHFWVRVFFFLIIALITVIIRFFLFPLLGLHTNVSRHRHLLTHISLLSFSIQWCTFQNTLIKGFGRGNKTSEALSGRRLRRDSIFLMHAAKISNRNFTLAHQDKKW